jgi:2-keto-4-pentenoate hydratase
MATLPDDPRIRRGLEAQFARRGELIADGERSIGWKIAFGAPAARERLNLEIPLIGFLLRRGLVLSGAEVSLVGWQKPVAEPEVAIHMVRDVAPGADRDTVKAAIGGIGPAIELADFQFPPEQIERLLANNVFQRHVILGPRDDTRNGCRLDGLTARLKRNGTEVATTTDIEASTGDLVDLVRHVANLLGEFGEKLHAGEFIISGSVLPPVHLEPSDREVLFELDPVGAASARFKPGWKK